MGRIIGYHGHFQDGKGFLVNDVGEVRTEPPYLDWLMETHAGPEFKKVAYDLDAFVACVLSLIDLTEQEGNELLAAGELYIRPYRVTYYPSKYFGIYKGGGQQAMNASFYDAGQYLDAPSLEKGMTPEKAVGKAKEARDVAARVSKIFFNLGWDGNTITSPIRSLEKSALAGLNLPTHRDIPPAVNDMALRSCRGSWVEAYRLGHFPKCFDYDIRSCYPHMLSKLLDLRRGDWTVSAERPEGALYGFQEGIVTMDAPFHPVLYGTEAGERSDFSYTPTGEWPTCLAADKVDFIREYRIGEFKPDIGWWWIPNGQQYEVMKGIINWLYQKREGKEGLELKVLKRAMAAQWGRTLEMRGEDYGPSFNPVYGALVEARTRIAVAKFVLDKGIEPIHVAVDGVLSGSLVDLPKDGGMGTWKLAHTGGAIVVSSGVAAVRGKEGAEDFSIKYEWLKKRIEDNPDAAEYDMRKMSVVTLAKALNTDFSKLGETEEITKTISIGGDGKRLYWEQPETGGDLMANVYESEPVDVSVAMGKAVA